MSALTSTLPARGQAVTPTQPTADASPDGAPKPGERERDRGEIVVTGSRVARPAGSVSPTPLTTVSAREIELRGAVNVADIVNQLPSLGTGQRPTTTTFSTEGAGANLLDLRSLGTNRTLVLVDGRRHVGGDADLAVDINTIPAALVKRVDVITGGASAVYGADAVAGVVNFILKDDYQGMDVGVRYGAATRGGAGNLDATALFGGNFGEHRGNTTVYIEYNDARGINQSNRVIRSYSFIPNPKASGLSNGQPATIPYQSGDFTSPTFAAAGGRAGVFGGLPDLPPPYNQPFIFDTNGIGVQPYNLGTDLGLGVNVGGDSVNFDETRNYQVPVERFLIGSKTIFNFGDKLTGFLDVKFSTVNVAYQQAPWYTLVTIQADNPYLPADLANALATSPTTNSFQFYRWDQDWGRQSIRVQSDTFRIATGLDYRINADWNIASYYQFGQFTSRIEQHTYATTAIDQALDTVSLDGQIVCRDPVARASGCLPVNPLAVSTRGLEDPAIARLRPTTVTRTEIEQQVANVAVTGTLPKMFFADKIGVAAGMEYRRESLSTVPDALGQSGDIIFGGNQSLSGAFNLYEGFAEVVVPASRDLPFAKALNLEAAVRVSSYSTVGRQIAWNAGGDWSPVRDIKFRAVYARAVRAPNVRELFTAKSNSDVAVADPCDARDIGLGSGTRVANCAALGLPANFRARANDGFSVTSVTEGNPRLAAEKADTITAGVVLQPRFAPRFSLTADYFNIRIAGVVNTFDAQTLLNNCVDFQSIANSACGTITRTASGQLSSISLRYINAASLQTSGVDLEARYNLPLLAGNLELRGLATYLDNYTFKPSELTLDVIKRDGYENFPKWRANVNAVYEHGPITLSWVARYYGTANIGTSKIDAATPVQQLPSNYKAQVYNDFQLRYSMKHPDAEFFIGADNVFDKGLPYTYFAGGISGAEGYDIVGRFVYGGIKFRLK